MSSTFLQEILPISPFTAVSTLLVLFLGILYFILKDKDLPPGPWGLPIVGYWPFLREDKVHLQLQELAKKYGDIYSFSVTGTLFIHIGNIKTLREAHVTKADCFADRYSQYSFLSILFADKGIAAANGEQWKVLRKFFVQSFREYGLTSLRDYMSGPIYDSVNASVNTLKATNGSPVNIIPILNERSKEIFCRMVFNDGEITNEELNGVLESYQNFVIHFANKSILLMGDVARYFVYPLRKGYKSALENHKIMIDHLTKLVRRHEKSFNEDNIRDLVDSYIKERNERRKKGDPSAELFTETALVHSLVQVVGDGILSVVLFIGYFLNALLEHPEEQEKIYKELVDVVGLDREMTLEDRNKLPYTNAFLQEVCRTSDFINILPSLVCTKETTLNGYRIPKGAITMMNFWSCHYDPNTYNEPDVFKPSRYISQSGKPKADAPVIFGMGKRACAGEAFTMMQVFLFVTTIIKNFHLEYPKGNKKHFLIGGIMEICAYPRK